MSDSLYDIFRTKCFALAQTTVIHSKLSAETQNKHLMELGYEVSQYSPHTWRYYKNLAGEYHEYDKWLISQINPDGHPYMRIKVAGDNKPVEVDFVKELVSGNSGDYSLAAEYSYGSDYYTELVNKYPGCETLILGILNPIDIDLAINSRNGDILYCGGYYRRLVPGVMKELYGFEKREDVIIDAEFLIEDWEEDLIQELQDYVVLYLKRWEVPDFAENHSFYPDAIKMPLMANLVPVIEKIRLKHFKTYAAHSYHVREYINSFGFLGEYVDALTREQQMYLYYNIDWLAANKGKQKTLQALTENLLTPIGIPLIAYNFSHYNWEMTTREKIDPQVEFNREALNLSDVPDVIGIDPLKMIIKEGKLARDNPLNINDQANRVDYLSNAGRYNALKTKVLESNYKVTDENQFFNLEEFQYNIWMLTAARGTYRGSVFVTHPTTGGRLQLTPKTALILFHYVYVKGFTGQTLEKPPKLRVRNIPKTNPVMYPKLEAYPTDEMLWEHISSDELTEEKVNRLKKFPPPVFDYTSTTDFGVQTKKMFDSLETRRSLAAREEDIHANSELELAVAKFYHLWVFLDPLADMTYEQWFSLMGIDLRDVEEDALRKLAMDIYNAALGNAGSFKNNAAMMHSSILNILSYFLSYTVQLVGEFFNSSARLYGFKQLRLHVRGENYLGLSAWFPTGIDINNVKQAHVTIADMRLINLFTSLGYQTAIGKAHMELIRLYTSTAPFRITRSEMNFVGFSMYIPNEENGVTPYVEKFTFSGLRQVNNKVAYADKYKVIGGVVRAGFSADGGIFVNDHGLSRVGPDDFEIKVSKN